MLIPFVKIEFFNVADILNLNIIISPPKIDNFIERVQARLQIFKDVVVHIK